MPTSVATTPVLIAGGGLVGLSAALFLQRLAVPFILVEKNTGVSPLPRARGIHLRTMELFRQAGVEDAVKDAAAGAWRQGAFGGARRGRTLVDAQPVIDIAAMRSKMAAIAPSPSSFAACPQTLIEPVLRRHIEARGADVRFGHELVSIDETGDTVIAIVRGPDGRETAIEAAWLVGADGGASFVRRHLGIDTADTPAPQHFVNIFFHADLGRTVQGRTFSQCEIANATVRGLFLAMDNADKWSFHLEYDPAQGPPPDHPLPGLVRAAIGLDDIDIDIGIRSRGTWNTGVRIATRYRSGRAFLCGDAAHVMPPWGGFNATTGIADAHNLAWKLAATLRGDADASLLDSYDTERRPLAVRNGHQALLRTDFDARFGIETDANRHLFAGWLDTGDLLLRHRYRESGDAPPDSVAQLQAQTGTRFPHAWIRRDGRQMSTLDLFGNRYVMLAGPSAPVTSSNHASLNRAYPAVLVAGKDFDFVDTATGWQASTALPDDGHVLIRPDGFVLRRSDERSRD